MFNQEPNPSIMKSMDSFSLIKAELETMPPDLISDNDLRSIPLVNESTDYERNRDSRTKKSFLLMNKLEDLEDSSGESFCKRLGSDDNDKFKVVAIFGNTGDGKSHTLNHTFFNGEEVFKTSAESDSCTIGVYAALQRQMGIICIDTEGLLGTKESTNHHRRLRMLLKILAISDIVIYRTRSERLHSDMYEFLDTASRAFCSHFSQALDSLDLPGTTQSLGPAVIIFHETRHTKPLESTISESAEDSLRKEFARLNMDTKAFNSLRYIGINSGGQTDFSKLREYVINEIDNTSVRSPRQPKLIFKAMQALNRKFSGEIADQPINPFPEQYFTCTVICESCNFRCQGSMGHIEDGEKHHNSKPCIYQHQYENKEYLCKSCYKNGRRMVVNIKTQNNGDSYWYGIAKYAWKGSVIECPNCGEIYRSRSYWYGNKTPEDIGIVRSEITHVWKGSVVPKGSVHSAQMVLDGVSYLSDAITSIGSQPTKLLSDWVADKVAPTYWRPNSEIKNCYLCKKNFEKLGLPKHHCRNCGEGFCNTCSSHKMPVPSRGWTEDVRVCNTCRTELLKKSKNEDSNRVITNDINNDHNTGVLEDTDIKVRKYGETFYNTLTTVASVLEYPKEMIKDTARPSYWIPDSDGPNCKICAIPFGTAEDLLNTQSTSTTPRKFTGDCKRHHCRSCGENVCEDCSSNRRPVPERGWHTDVRVCDDCFIKNKTE